MHIYQKSFIFIKKKGLPSPPLLQCYTLWNNRPEKCVRFFIFTKVPQHYIVYYLMGSAISRVCFETNLESFFLNSSIVTSCVFGFFGLIIFTWNGANSLVEIYKKLFFHEDGDGGPQMLFHNDDTTEIISHLNRL